MIPQDKPNTIEVSMADIKNTIEFGDALDRLLGNADFKTVFVEGYIKQEPTRLADLAAVASNEFQYACIHRDIDAIGSFRQYIRTVNAMTEEAKRCLQQAEANASDEPDDQESVNEDPYLGN